MSAQSPFQQATTDATPTKHQAIHRYPTRRPAELEAPPVDQAEYTAYRTATDLREPYRVPLAYLRDTKKFVVPDLPEAPLIVFINSRSGGRAGPALTETLFHALGHSQVYDLREYRPGPVLQKIYSNVSAAIRNGDKTAPVVRSRLRILAAGGDGTVSWILNTVRELQLDPPPAVAVMPLGTGNDLSLSFGWGNTFLHKWIADYKTLYATMKRIADAEPRDLDTWSIGISAGNKGLFKQLPHSLALVKDLQRQRDHKAKVEGLFYNYFSVGLDAQAAYGFHHLRETKAWAAPSRLINQAWYAYFSCASGWFCCAPPLNATATLKVKTVDGKWEPVRIPSSVKAIVLLNLQSYGGGRDIWGLADNKNDTQRGWKTPIFNDGMFEAVGLLSGYHTAIVMGGLYYKVHGLRLAQASEMQLDLKANRPHGKGKPARIHMQLDGEPWQQELPCEEAEPPLHISVSPSGTSSMLFNTEKLQGMPKKIKALARREAEVSFVQQLSIGTAASLPNPGAFPSLGPAQAGSPHSPITIALPATRQPEALRGHRRAQSGNPAVPVAQQLTGAEQCQAPPDDSTEQSLSFGRPSEGKESSSPVLPGSTAVMQPAIAQTPGSSTQPSTSMPGTSGAEASNAAAASSLIPASTQAMGQGEIRHGQRQGQGSALSDQASASSLPAVATSFAGQDSGQNDSRLAQAHIPPALQFGPSTSATALEAAVTESGAKSAAVGSGSSQQARQHQSAAAASDRQDSLRGYEIHRSLPPSTDAGLQHPQGSASHLAEQGVVLGSDSGGMMKNTGQSAAVGARPNQAAESISPAQRTLANQPPSATWNDIEL